MTTEFIKQKPETDRVICLEKKARKWGIDLKNQTQEELEKSEELRRQKRLIYKDVQDAALQPKKKV